MSRLTQCVATSVACILLLTSSAVQATADPGSPVDNAFFNSSATYSPTSGSVTLSARQSSGTSTQESKAGTTAGSTRKTRSGAFSGAAPANEFEWAQSCDPFDIYCRVGFTAVKDPTAPRAPGAPRPATPAGPTRADIQALVREASTTLQLPLGAPQIGPNPANNEWNMIPVGYPIWLWTSDPTTADASTTRNGIALQLTARRDRVTFTMGDGTTIRCATTTPYASSTKPMTASPTCGHTYQRKGLYTISATTTWTVTWNALGMTGTLPVTRTTNTTLDVGELVSVLVAR